MTGYLGRQLTYYMHVAVSYAMSLHVQACMRGNIFRSLRKIP